MSQTLRRELRIRFGEILQSESIAENRIEILTNMLADIAIKHLHTKPVILGIEAAIMQGRPVTQEDMAASSEVELATFEGALGVGTWPWYSTPEWTRFAKFVKALDPNLILRYAVWRDGEGKFKAMSNRQIRDKPQQFMDTGWPTFLDAKRPPLNPTQTECAQDKWSGDFIPPPPKS